MFTISINFRPKEWNWKPWGFYNDGRGCMRRQAAFAFLMLRIDVS